jgi:hypothetical protein
LSDFGESLFFPLIFLINFFFKIPIFSLHVPAGCQPKYGRILKIFYFPLWIVAKFWLIPLVDDCQCS